MSEPLRPSPDTHVTQGKPDASEGGTTATVAAPVLSVVRGEPTTEQLAALIAVLAARAAARTDDEPATPSRWGSPSSALRRPVTPGPGAWQASALPGAR